MPPVNRLAPQPANSFAEYGPYGPVTSDPAASAAYQQQLVSGLGSGLANQLRGMYQTVRHAATSRPIDDIRGALASLAALYDDPMQALQALREMRQRAMSGPQGLGQVLGELAPLPGPSNALRRPPRMELDVYHATPHRFEPTANNPLGEFDASKIGTGEGAQAYGHGIYTAESPGTAQSYYDQFKQQIQGSFDTVIDRRLDAFMQEFGGDVQKAADRFMAGVYDTPKNKAAMRKEVLERLEARTRQPYMLKADLPDEMIDRMLDWNKPLREQNIDLQRFAPEMRKRIQSIPSSFGTLDVPLEVAADMLKSKTGLELYKMLADHYGDKAASKMLKDAGIPGIRYLDAGSRDGGSGTRNFVVFPGEEKKVRILERK